MPAPRSIRDPWQPALDHLRCIDERWAARIDQVGPCRLKPHRDRFAMLVRAIISQQISTKAAQTINQRVCDLCAGRHDAARLLALDDSELRGAGLSTMKVKYVRSLADAVHSGRLPLRHAGRWSDDDLIERLTQVSGIGRWTAEMFMVFALNRADVLSVGDLGIRAGIQRHYDLPTPPGPQECLRLAEPWRPYRSVAMWYLWREKDTSPPTGQA